MKNKILTLIFSLTFSSLCLASFETNEFFVKVKNETNIDISLNSKTSIKEHPLNQILNKIDVDSIYKPFKTKDANIQSTYVVRIKNRGSFSKLARLLSKYDFIDYVERIPTHELFYTPNDPLFNQQWYLPHINAPQAWDISTGSNNIVIAIVDDAVRLDHEDLAGAIFQNPNEFPNGQDDDGNGFIDDINGWDAADNNNNPNPPLANVTSSNFTHGTHVAGIAAATTDNATGMASIGFSCKILPVKIKTDASTGPGLQASIQGVDYAIACGYSNVVNMSFGGAGYSQTFQNLITAGHNQGIVFVAAAGNSNTNAPMYPASYNHVISVAATTRSNQKANFSNYGLTVDVSAPGVAILSSMATGVSDYSNMQGTSMASPLVAGLCGLMLSHSPGSTPQEIEDCLKSTATNIHAQNPQYINQLGAGVVNAQAALSCLISNPIANFSSDLQLACSEQNIQFHDQSSGIPTSWSWQFPGGTPATSTLQNPIVSYLANGTYSVTLEVSNALGSDITTYTNYINIETPTATLSGSTTIPSGGTAYLQVVFTGNPPFDITYTDGVNQFTINNITQNPFYFSVAPSTSTTYSLTGATSPNCTLSVSGIAEVEVRTYTSNDTCDTMYWEQLPNAISNPSFEDYNCVPTWFSQFSCASQWVEPTNGTPDYFVYPGWIYNSMNQAGYTYPPDGSAFMGLQMVNYSNQLEYVGICLNQTLTQGTFHKIKFWVAAHSRTQNDQLCTFINTPINFTIFGSETCSSMPMNTNNCPTSASSNWVNLGNVSYTPNLAWIEIELEFFTTIEVNALIFGPPCVIPTEYTFNCRPFFLFDDFRLSQLITYSYNCDSVEVCNYSKTYTANDNVELYYSDFANYYVYSCGKQTIGTDEYGWVVKTDMSGNVVWSKSFSGINEFRSLYIHDNHLYLISNTNASNRDLVVYKTDLNGNIVWNQQYNSGGRDIVFLIKSGGFFYDSFSNTYKLTYWRSPTAGSMIDDLGILEIDGANGNIVSSSRFHLSGDDEIYHVVKDRFSNNLIYSGAVGSGGESPSHIARFSHGVINTTSNTVNAYERLDVNASSWGFGYSASTQLNDNSRAVLGCWKFAGGNTNGYPFVFKMDNSGNTIWAKRINFYLPNSSSLTNFIRESEIFIDKENNIIIKFSIDHNNSLTDDLLLIKYDSNGNYLKSVLIENSHKGAIKFIEASVKDFIYTGYNSNNNQSVTVQIFNSDLEACNFRDTTITDENFVWTQTSNSYVSLNLTTNISSFSSSQTDYLVGESFICGNDCDSSALDINCLNKTFNNTICKGDTLQLSAEDGNNYAWSPPYNMSNYYIQNPLIWPSVDTSFIVGFNDTSGCFRLDTFNIAVSTPEVFIANSDTTICSSEMVQLNASGAITYEWTPSTNLSNPNISNPIFNGTSDSQLILKGINENGCEAFDTININVLPCCGAFLDIEVSNNYSCISSAVEFINNSIYSNNFSFDWYFGTDATPNTYTGITPPPVEFNSVGIHEILIVLNDDCGTDSLFLNVNILDLPSVRIADDTSICVFGNFSYPLGDDRIWGFTYNWTPATGLDNPTSSNPMAVINSSQVYFVEVVDEFGCTYSDSVSISVSSIENGILTNTTNYCIGDTLIIYHNIVDVDSIFWNDSIQTDTLLIVLNNDTTVYLSTYNDNCIYHDTLHISPNEKPTLSVSNDTTVCIGDTIELFAFSNYNIVWNTNENSDTIIVQILADTIFTVTSTNFNCFVVDNIITLADTFPIINVAPTIEVNQGEEIQISVAGGENWSWSPSTGLSCNDCQAPFHTAFENVLYTITSTNNSCSTWVSVQIIVREHEQCLQFPDAFTPNNDGLNDFYYPVNNFDVEITDFKVYNRWGELVHSSNIPWNGEFKTKEQPSDMYVYFVTYTCFGENFKSMGSFSLIR